MHYHVGRRERRFNLSTRHSAQHRSYSGLIARSVMSLSTSNKHQLLPKSRRARLQM